MGLIENLTKPQPEQTTSVSRVLFSDEILQSQDIRYLQEGTIQNGSSGTVDKVVFTFPIGDAEAVGYNHILVAAGFRVYDPSCEVRITTSAKNKKHYGSLLNQLADDIGDDVAGHLRSGTTYTDLPLHPYPRDLMVTKIVGNKRIGVLPRKIKQGDHSAFFSAMIQEGLVDDFVIAPNLVFDGGDLLADDRTLFVGVNSLKRTAQLNDVSVKEAAREFEKTFGLPVVAVGAEFRQEAQFYDLDIVLTPLGGSCVALADLGLARDLLRDSFTLDRRDFESMTKATSKGQYLTLDEVDNLFFATQYLKKLIADGTASKIGEDMAKLRMGLVGAGYDVVSFPAVWSGVYDKEEQPYVCFLPNNCLVTGSNIYLPRSTPQIEDYFLKLFQRLHKTTRFIHGASAVNFGNEAGLHCLTQERRIYVNDK